MTQELADADEARESVFEFRTELRRGRSAEPEEGPTLRVYLELDGRVVPSSLAWTGDDGAHSAIAFTKGTSEFAGVHRDADGAPALWHGRLASRRAYPSLPAGVRAGDVLTFDTQERLDLQPAEDARNGEAQDSAAASNEAESAGAGAGAGARHGEVWKRAGRLRLLLDDGRGCALRDLQWQDTRGLSAAVSFTPEGTGFVGYLDRPWQEPVEYRGFAVPGRPAPSSDELMQELEEFGRQALGVVEDLLGRIGGWLGGGGNGPRPS